MSDNPFNLSELMRGAAAPTVKPSREYVWAWAVTSAIMSPLHRHGTTTEIADEVLAQYDARFGGDDEA